MLVDVLLSIFFFLGIYYYLNPPKKYKLPPGPWNIPFTSGIFIIDAHPCKIYKKWAQQYGPLISTKFGFQNALVIDDPKLMREAFSSPAFSGRPDIKTFELLTGGSGGILNGSGRPWAEQRRFAIRALRDFGFGKRSMEECINEEITEFLIWMKENEGIATELKPRLVLATISTLWSMLAGERINQEDTVLKEIVNRANSVFNEVEPTEFWVIFPQVIDVLPKVFLHSYYQLVEHLKPFLQIFADAITHHVETHSLNQSEPRDFIDLYLNEVKKTTDSSSSFYGEIGTATLRIILADLYSAGQGTTSNLLAWAVIYLVRFPHVQQKLQAELGRVVGHNRLPKLTDRPNLPYTEALIMELHRFSSLMPLSLFHETTKNTQLGGYDIQKGTVVMANTYSMNNSTERYGDPENFRPERFLSTDELTVIKCEDLMPFGTGKRQCLGETLGRDNFFLFLTSIFHRFEIGPDLDNGLPSLEPVPGFFFESGPFTVTFKERL